MTCNKKLDLADLRKLKHDIFTYAYSIAQYDNKFLMLHKKISALITELMNASEREETHLPITCLICKETWDYCKFNAKEHAKKHEEENKMKHPCEKVLDVSKLVQTRKGNKARIICTDKKTGQDRLIVSLVDENKGAYESAYYHKPCGHINNAHLDSDYDLVNVPEVKEIDLDKFKLTKDKDGITISGDGWYILRITNDGVLRRTSCINKCVGLQLDEQGRIKLDE